jgi:hypothetical protein
MMVHIILLGLQSSLLVMARVIGSLVGFVNHLAVGESKEAAKSNAGVLRGCWLTGREEE